MRSIARVVAGLPLVFAVVACGTVATAVPTTPAQPTAGPPTATPTLAPTEAPTPEPTEPAATVAATCIDVTNADEPTTVQASAAGFSWSPGEVTAKVGDVITWRNRDTAGHRVATDDGSCLMTSNIRGGGSRSLRFTTAGEYPFHCVVHPTMKGTLIITE